MSHILEQKFDERGNSIYERRQFCGEYEIWREFNEQNDLIHYKSTLLYTEEWYFYDYKNNLYYVKNQNGYISYHKLEKRGANPCGEYITKEEYKRIQDEGKGILLRFELMEI